MIFSERLKLAKEVEEFATKNNVKLDVLGVITILKLKGKLIIHDKKSEGGAE